MTEDEMVGWHHLLNGHEFEQALGDSESESRSVVSDSLRPHGLYSPWNSPGQNTGVGQPFPSPGDFPNPRIKSRFPTLQADSLPAEPQGSPRILEWVAYSSPVDLPNPGIEPGLLHCRRILYQLSHREAQQYWNGQPIPSPGNLPNPGIEPRSPALQADSLPAEPQGKPNKFYGSM